MGVEAATDLSSPQSSDATAGGDGSDQPGLDSGQISVKASESAKLVYIFLRVA